MKYSYYGVMNHSFGINQHIWVILKKDLTVPPNSGITVTKGNHPQAARLREVTYYNLHYLDKNIGMYVHNIAQ